MQLPKAHAALQEVRCSHRLVLLDGQLSPTHHTLEDLLALLGFVYTPARPDVAAAAAATSNGGAPAPPPAGVDAGAATLQLPPQPQLQPGVQPMLELETVLGEDAGALPADEAAAKLLELLRPHATPAFGAALYPAPPLRHEVLVPVHMTPPQVRAPAVALPLAGSGSRDAWRACGRWPTRVVLLRSGLSRWRRIGRCWPGASTCSPTPSRPGAQARPGAPARDPCGTPPRPVCSVLMHR